MEGLQPCFLPYTVLALFSNQLREKARELLADCFLILNSSWGWERRCWPAHLALELVLEAEGLVSSHLQLPVRGPLVPELALQRQHLVAELPDTQPEVVLGHLGLRVPELWEGQMRRQLLGHGQVMVFANQAVPPLHSFLLRFVSRLKSLEKIKSQKVFRTYRYPGSSLCLFHLPRERGTHAGFPREDGGRGFQAMAECQSNTLFSNKNYFRTYSQKYAQRHGVSEPV